jgi:peptide/nickel transport system substrate-binding protein
MFHRGSRRAGQGPAYATLSGVVLALALLVACDRPAAPTIGPTSAPPAAQPTSTAAGTAPTAAKPIQAQASTPASAPTQAAAPSSSTPPLRISLNERVTTMDPNDHNLLGPFQVQTEVYEPLVRRNDKGDWEGVLAASWRNVDDLTWEFKLRSGVKFHDGTDFDANAVKATIDRFLNKDFAAKSAQAYQFVDFDHVEVVDPLTVRIITKKPVATMLPTLQLAAMIPSPKLIKPGESIKEGFVGTGPYKFVSWKPGEEVDLEANPNYWGPKPAVQKVVFIYQADSSTSLSSVRAGDVDIAEGISNEQLQEIKNDANITSIDVPSSQIMWMAFGHKEGAMTDRRIREAATIAIDRDTLCKTLLEDRAQCINGYLPPSVFGYAEMPPRPYDPERAKQLLAEAGYPNGGPDVRFITIPATPTDMTEAVADQLQRVGFRVKLEVLEVAAYLDARKAGNMQVFMNGFANINGDASAMLPAMIGTDARGLYKNKQVLDLLEQAATTLDSQKRADLYKQAQQVAWDDYSDPWIFVMRNIYVVRNGWQNFQPDPAGMMRVERITHT